MVPKSPGASDQYSLGAVAYEMITGASPFTGSLFTVVQAHLEQPPRSIRDRCEDCPPELESAVLRMLEKAPAARWPSIAQAKAALGATPLLEEDPLLSQLCRLASPDWTSSVTKFMPPGPRTKVSSAAPAGLAWTRAHHLHPPSTSGSRDGRQLQPGGDGQGRARRSTAGKGGSMGD